MKKISHLSTISSIALLAFIVPQIAFAAWWNPISWFGGWNFFHRTDTQTQVLENRVKELEKKLENATTSTPVITTKTMAPAKTKAVETPAPKKADPIATPAKTVAPIQPAAPSADSQTGATLLLIERCKVEAQTYIDNIRESMLKIANDAYYACTQNNTTAILQMMQPYSGIISASDISPAFSALNTSCHDKVQNFLTTFKSETYNQKYLACLNRVQ